MYPSILTPQIIEVPIPINVATESRASKKASFPEAFNGSELTCFPTLLK